MKLINHNVLVPFEKVIIILINIFSFLKSKDIVRVLVYHNIENRYAFKLKDQLQKLKKDWKFINVKDFENHINEKKILKGKNLLLTFDDGFKSNFYVAKKILKKLNIKAVFFVPSDFVKIKKNVQLKKFVKKNIFDNQKINNYEKFKNMTIKDLKSLIKDGHTIGCHTKTHANLGFINNIAKLKKEILDSAKSLENLLKIKVKHFAYTYGNYRSINDKSLIIAFKRYDFIYSCLRGNNFKNKKKNIIKRDTVYLDSSNNLLKICLSGMIDLKYIFDLKKINKKIAHLKL